MLNTNEFVKVWQDLEKAKNPDLPFYLYSSPYAYLTGLLSALIENQASVKKSQEVIDEVTQELKQKLSDLSDKLELQK